MLTGTFRRGRGGWLELVDEFFEALGGGQPLRLLGGELSAAARICGSRPPPGRRLLLLLGRQAHSSSISAVERINSPTPRACLAPCSVAMIVAFVSS